jgi:hypothetical protein
LFLKLLLKIKPQRANKMRKYHFLFSLSILLLFSFPLVARDFRIVGIPGKPLRYYDKNIELVGIDVDIIRQIMSTLKIRY